MAAEALGSLLLSTTVIGSGIMAERLANGNLAVALLANTAATVAALAVLISLLAPDQRRTFQSGGDAGHGAQACHHAVGSGPVCGGADRRLLPGSFAGARDVRDAAVAAGLTRPQWSGAMAGGIRRHRRMLLVILGNRREADAPWLVALWIGAAYWFTSSTSFANPAITLARALTDSFAGIRPADVPAFIVAQLGGALAALLAARGLFSLRRS